jgi:uncharacterized protein YjbI with pentapeptide repeats
MNQTNQINQTGGGFMDTTNPIRSKLRIPNDAMYRLLREGCITEFNVKKASGEKVDLRACDLRGLDLRGLDADGLDLSDCYFRQSDLRSVDFSKARLEGASINAAKISGAYFPPELTASEIELSLLHGSRMRYSSGKF